METDGEVRYQITVLTGAKTVVPEEYVRLIMQRPKWWEWRYKRERAEMVAMAANYGMNVYES